MGLTSVVLRPFAGHAHKIGNTKERKRERERKKKAKEQSYLQISLVWHKQNFKE